MLPFRFLAALVLATALALPVAAHFKLASHGGQGSGGGSTQNVLTVSLTTGSGLGENVTPGASVGTLVSHVTATTDNGAFTGTFSMVNTGLATQGPSCTVSSNNFTLVSTGLGTADLQVNNGSLTAQNFGAPPAAMGFICIKATPTSGTAWTREFTIMVRGPTFTSFTPLTIPNAPTAANSTLATLAVTIANGPSPAPTFALGGDAACTGLVISGSLLKVGGSTYTGSGICHITATQSTVTPSSYVAAVYISPSAYVGPGDVMSWNLRADLYGYSAAYVAPGTNPAFTLKRETDLTTQIINVLPSGDVDLATAANFCANSYCYGILWNDQSGNGNNLHAWAFHQGETGPTLHLPGWQINCVNGTMPCWPNDNGTDRFWQDSTYASSTVTTGTMAVVAWENGAAFGGRLISMNSTGGASNPITAIGFLNTTGADLYVGFVSSGSHGTAAGTVAFSDTTSNSFMSGMVGGALTITAGSCTVGSYTVATFVDSGHITLNTSPGTCSNAAWLGGTAITATAAPSVMHSLIGTVNTSSSVFKVDGTEGTGTLGTASLGANFWGPAGDWGGGALAGWTASAGMSATIATSGNRTSLCNLDNQHYATGGTC